MHSISFGYETVISDTFNSPQILWPKNTNELEFFPPLLDWHVIYPVFGTSFWWWCACSTLLRYAVNCYHSKSKWWFTPLGSSLLAICSIFSTCFPFFQHEDLKNNVEIITVITQTVWTLLSIFAVCELGERIRMAFEEVNAELNQLKWYLLPRRSRKLLPIILMATQDSVEFNIFGTTASNRKTFKEASPMRFTRGWLVLQFNTQTNRSHSFMP